jgi:transcriptional regulator with XRE-family HTH domain
MKAGTEADKQEPRIGPLLKKWRKARRLSQLELALAADVSPRHLSFLESGRAKPSREMLLRLSGVLDVPFRESNLLLQAAGFAAVYRETSLTDPEMDGMRHALQLILRQHEPFAAVAVDRQWDIVMVNAPYAGLLAGMRAPAKAPAPLTFIPRPRPNALRLLFDPRGFRPHIENWARVAREILGRLNREVLWNGNEAAGALLQELLATEGVPADWRQPDLEVAPSLVLPLEIRLGECKARFFTTLTTVGAPQDVTLQELRVESFHPADVDTERLVRQNA